MDYRPTAFDRHAALDPVSAALIARALGRKPRRGAAAGWRIAGLIVGLPLHLAALALWWPARGLLAGAGVDREQLDRVTGLLAG